MHDFAGSSCLWWFSFHVLHVQMSMSSPSCEASSELSTGVKPCACLSARWKHYHIQRHGMRLSIKLVYSPNQLELNTRNEQIGCCIRKLSRCTCFMFHHVLTMFHRLRSPASACDAEKAVAQAQSPSSAFRAETGHCQTFTERKTWEHLETLNLDPWEEWWFMQVSQTSQILFNCIIPTFHNISYMFSYHDIIYWYLFRF